MSSFLLLATTAAKPVTPGSTSYTTAGSHTFTVPFYNTITIEVWGGGGGGAWYNTGSYGPGGVGGTSTAVITQGTLTGNGGQQGLVWSVTSVGGTGSGPAGTTTVSGGDSLQVNPYPTGGAGGNGGAGGYYLTAGGAGTAPGGGGAGYSTYSPGGNYRSVSGGGGGGYASYTTTADVGSSISIVVGAGGTAAAGVPLAVGGIGRVTITWS
jgi:hypothetical protein